tara:strand:- start:79 stop:543 length:465 start_codon:yes stop_codon:yes gene_type:complete
MLIFFTLLLSSGNVLSQNCKAELKVEKDRNFKSADKDGAVFYLVLTNSSSQKDSFIITKSNLITPCNNSTYNTPKSNTELNSTILGSNSKAITGDHVVSLSPGQTYKFQVKVEAPSKKDYNHWSCIEIKASSQNCRNVVSATTLSVYSSDPSEQ